MADETNQLRVRLVTPERTFFDQAAVAVDLPSKSGYFEVLYGHAPLMAELGAGDVIIHGGADPKTGEAGSSSGDAASLLRYNVSWGFVEVLGDRVTILASDALKPEEIDVPRAQEQLARGQKEWNEAGDSEAAYTEALRVIHEAEAKIASAAEKH
ncbi:MAG: ATP synthase F1 subunit epsilon [Terracidiphilus sp.]|jgi:F-type H+-transporting ATPase subunit epsilon